MAGQFVCSDPDWPVRLSGLCYAGQSLIQIHPGLTFKNDGVVYATAKKCT